ncbi:hypothetical protein P154DRAFT_605851 [Amniculicola lignicola CBS 123094]|uniref:Uncharacterized protein n=1 Tax=Amniculicola lignicola CBS 123094 TaxID=1392246 RepID=A0A6A5W983_9PLEO|nr:hypothetical protein P154DRAFT_605851 [Amniculicola lignicola CBS 123094]
MSHMSLTKSALHVLNAEFANMPNNGASLCSSETDDVGYHTPGDINISKSAEMQHFNDGYEISESVARAVVAESSIAQGNLNNMAATSSNADSHPTVKVSETSLQTLRHKFDNQNWQEKLAILLLLSTVGIYIIGPCMCNTWFWMTLLSAFLVYDHVEKNSKDYLSSKKPVITKWLDPKVAAIMATGSAFNLYVYQPWRQAQVAGYMARYHFACIISERLGLNQFILDELQPAVKLGRGLCRFAQWIHRSFLVPTANVGSGSPSSSHHAVTNSRTSAASHTATVIHNAPKIIEPETGETQWMEEAQDRKQRNAPVPESWNLIAPSPRQNLELEHWSTELLAPHFFRQIEPEHFRQDYVFLANFIKLQGKGDWTFADLADANLVSPTDIYGDNEIYAQMVDTYWINKGEHAKAIGIDYSEEDWDRMEKEGIDRDRNRNTAIFPPQNLMARAQEEFLNAYCAESPTWWERLEQRYPAEDLDLELLGLGHEIPVIREKVIRQTWHTGVIEVRWITYRDDLPTGGHVSHLEMDAGREAYAALEAYREETDDPVRPFKLRPGDEAWFDGQQEFFAQADDCLSSLSVSPSLHEQTGVGPFLASDHVLWIAEVVRAAQDSINSGSVELGYKRFLTDSSGVAGSSVGTDQARIITVGHRVDNSPICEIACTPASPPILQNGGEILPRAIARPPPGFSFPPRGSIRPPPGFESCPAPEFSGTTRGFANPPPGFGTSSPFLDLPPPFANAPPGFGTSPPPGFAGSPLALTNAPADFGSPPPGLTSARAVSDASSSGIVHLRPGSASLLSGANNELAIFETPSDEETPQELRNIDLLHGLNLEEHKDIYPVRKDGDSGYRTSSGDRHKLPTPWLGRPPKI